MVKRIISFFMAMLLLCSYPVTSFACENSMKNETNDLVEVIEREDEYYRVIRSYINNQSLYNDEGNINFDKLVTILKLLGMDDYSIAMLDDEAIRACADGKELYYITSYTKNDADGNVVYITKDEALQSVSELKIRQKQLLNNIINAEDSERSRAITSYQDSFSDSYMVINYLVSHEGSGYYFYSVSSVWLTMPYFRGIDSLGSCAQNSTVSNNTRSGYCWYGVTEYNSGNVTTNSVTTYSGISYGNAANGNWYGAACSFNLPDDYISDNYYIVYDSFGAHFQYSGYINYPTVESWFNAVGSYTHTRWNVSFSPSFTITYPGSVSASIGLNVNQTTDIRGAEVLIHHVP